MYIRNRKKIDVRMETRRKSAVDLYLQGKPMWEIAQILGCTAATISTDIAAMQAKWKEQAIRSIDEKKNEELAKINRIEEQAWEGWERSCRDAETKTTKIEKMPPRVPTKKDGVSAKPPKGFKLKPVIVKEEHTSQAKGQSGDTRFLDTVAWCVETRMKVLGILDERSVNVNQTVVNWDSLAKPVLKTVDTQVDAVEERIKQVASNSVNGNGKH